VKVTWKARWTYGNY